MSYRVEIALLGQDLAPGANLYTTCPACERAGKFSVGRSEDGSLLYHCFRASCVLNGGGALLTGGQWSTGERRPQRPKRAVFSEPITVLPEHRRIELSRLIGWGAQHREIARPMYCTSKDRFAFPILSYLGVRKGWVLRTWDQTRWGPKALTYLDEEDSTRTSYYVNMKDRDKVIIVEDIPSAVRAAPYMSAIALQGTSCNMNTAYEIASRFKHVIWALDDDATKQSLRLAKEHALLFEESDVLRLTKDLKDMNESELERILNTY